MRTYSISFRRSLLWLMALTALPFKAMAVPAQLSIEPFTIHAGESKEMAISLTNPDDEITLVQFDLRLPEGLNISQTGGELDIDIADRTTWRKHSLEANELSSGLYRFLLASSSNAILNSTEGPIVKIMLTAANDFTGGSVRLENILLVTPDEKETKPADVEIVIGSNPPDPPAPCTSQISIEPLTIPAGESKEMTIDLTNPDDEITLVQFDLQLPEGLSVKQTGGEYDIDIAGRTTWRKHSLDANEIESRRYRFLLASSSNTVLSGTEGAIIKVTLTAANGFAGGTAKLEDILLVTPDEKEIRPEAFSIYIDKGDGINATKLEGKPVSVYDYTGRRLAAPQRGVNLLRMSDGTVRKVVSSVR